MQKKIKKIQIFRHIIQIAALVLSPGLFILTLGEMKKIYEMIINGKFNFIQAFPSLLEFTTVIFITILLGRFFCGWICAFGAFNDFLHLISKKVFKINFKVNEKVDAVLKYVKYIILLLIVVVSWTIGSDIFQGASPWDAFAQITDLPQVLSDYTVGCILLVLIAIGAFFVERFFCRYLCPLGAVFTIFSKISIFKIKKPKDNCGKCRLCTNNCSMGLPLYKVNSVCGGDCINCLQCVETCPRKNTQANVLGENVNPALASSVAIAAFAGVYAVNNFAGTTLVKSGLISPTSVSVGTSTLQNYKDGTYTGTGTGFHNGTTEVEVTVKNGKISNIKTVSNEDTPDFYNRVENTMFGEIISAQSTQVDTVSGATFSSKGIISAVQNALKQAVVDSSTSSNPTNDTITSNSSNTTSTDSSDESTKNSTGTNNTASSSNNAPSKSGGTTNTNSNSKSINSGTTATNNNQVSSNSSTPGTSNNVPSINNNAASTNSNTTSTGASSNSTTSHKYKDGTYIGRGTGFRGGTTKVSITIENDKITSIETVSTQDTPRFYENTEGMVTSEIISAQSTQVDTVSGATFSSRGIISAVQNALSQAKL